MDLEHDSAHPAEDTNCLVGHLLYVPLARPSFEKYIKIKSISLKNLYASVFKILPHSTPDTWFHKCSRATIFLGCLSTSDLPGVGANITVGWEQETRRKKCHWNSRRYSNGTWGSLQGWQSSYFSSVWNTGSFEIWHMAQEFDFVVVVFVAVVW